MRRRKPFGRFDPNKPYRPRTAAQGRALYVFRLRGIYYGSYALTGWRARLFRWLIDQELLHVYGVETQTERHDRQRREAYDEPYGNPDIPF